MKADIRTLISGLRMRSTGWNRAVRIAEIAITALVTLMLLPTILLYVLDLMAGAVAPDAELGFGAAIGLFGLWVTLLAGDALNRPKSRLRWAVMVALVLAVISLFAFAWGLGRTPGSGVVSVFFIGASIAVAVHQLVVLFRGLKPRAGEGARR